MTNYNKSEIMARAWEMHGSNEFLLTLIAKNPIIAQFHKSAQSRPFGYFLKKAWAEAKAAGEQAIEAEQAPAQTIEAIERQIFTLKMKDRWSREDYSTMDKLQAEQTAILNKRQTA